MNHLLPCGLFALACSLAAQQRISLDGPWTLCTEPPDASAASRLPTTVPSAFEATLGPAFDGVAWYERRLPLPDERAPRVRIEFAAVATQATVFCNGIGVGRHLGAWTPFSVDVSAALRWDGTDELRVRVDEAVGHDTQGFLPVIQPHFGGIWQGVTLCLDRGPVVDRHALFAFGRGNGDLVYAVPVLDPATHDLQAMIAVCAGDETLAETRVAVDAGSAVSGVLPVPGVRPWAPGSPHLYTFRVTLRRGEREIDRVERRVGFRDLRADGTRVLWNGAPLQVRGILHWGYSPPHLAPPTDPAYWRRQLAYFQSLGFNCLKCCLWVPPPCVHELADELGMLVWQEYPTWHPRMDQAHKQQLLAEYGEFFARDRNHPAVALRSITCETGHGADLDVVKALFDACKAAVPDTLVVDDSSWIGWQRVTDFWDEHPYGNNSWFPGRLADFERHIAVHGAKPLLLGECIAADTWADRTEWNGRHGEQAHWWRPDCWLAQAGAETWLHREFGAATAASLRPLSLDFALRNRQFQIEQLRLRLPDAGYVVSVARDFGKARMGLLDDFDQPKWDPARWAWHRDTMLCLDLPWNGRALSGANPRVPVRISHYGVSSLVGELRVWSDDATGEAVVVPVTLEPGTVSAPILLELAPGPGVLNRVRVRAELTGSHGAKNQWDLWRVPASSDVPATDVRVVHALTTELLTDLENGARVLLHAGAQPGSLRTEALWFLKGAPFAPEHPVHATLARDALLELSSFDLETGRVMPWLPWRDQVDPILAFWETHDLAEVRFHLLAFDCRVGKGRLLATTLDLDPGHPLGRHVGSLLQQHLQAGEAPRRALSTETIAALRAVLGGKTIDLTTWRFRTDPRDEGRRARWHAPETDASTADWRDLRAGAHWETQAEDLRAYTGVAWYRIDVEVPADWRGADARAVFDGVDDSFEVWLNGEPAGSFGDPATRTSVWLERQVAELGQRLRPGQKNTLVLRVVDHAGAGGLWKPAFLSTGPADGRGTFLN